MNTKMLTMSRRLWATGNRSLDRRNQLAWVRAVRRLGSRWLLATYVPKKEMP